MPLPEAVRVELERAGIPLTAVSLEVQALDQEFPQLSWNADQARPPASLIKLVTTFAALVQWGPSYRWDTQIFGPEPADTGKVSALYLVGKGDPMLTLEDWQSLLRQLRTRGVNQIDGDILVQGPPFGSAGLDVNGFDGLGFRAYNALPAPLQVNSRAWVLHLVPQPQGRARVVPDPNLPHVQLVNSLASGPGECAEDWKNEVGLTVQDLGKQATVRLGGRLPLGCGERSLFLEVLDDLTWLEGLFRTTWQDLGGGWSGHLRRAPVSSLQLPLLAQWQSAPLGALIGPMNKYSNNLMARTLFLDLGLAEKRPELELKQAASARVVTLLRQNGLEFPEMVLDNGAGLSRHTRISAAHLGKLLRAASHALWQGEFWASLAWLGQEGTVEQRLSQTALAGRFRLKTGSLQGVSGMAGYGLDQYGHWVTLVFMVEHPQAAAALAAQDALLRWIYRGCVSGASCQNGAEGPRTDGSSLDGLDNKIRVGTTSLARPGRIP